MATRQLSFFHTTATRTDEDKLIRLRPSAHPPTKAQQTFKKRIAQVEGLRAKLERESARLDKALTYFGEHIHPRLKRVTTLRKDLVRAFAPYLSDKRLKGKNRKKTLRQVIADQIDYIVAAEGSLQDADLRELFERIHRITFEEARAEEAEGARLEMESMLEDMGFDVDLSGFSPGMNEESFQAEFAEMTRQIEDQFNQQKREPRGQRRKSRKQMQREEQQSAAEDVRKKSIAAMYKQLARALHPDLESDIELRQRKTSLMQELTMAYRNNDLHTLLRLELEWIERERGDLDRLTADKLAIYNDVLKEQADNLRAEIDALPYHPRYAALMVNDGPFGDMRLRTEGKAEAFQLDYLIEQMQKTLARMQTDEAIAVVQETIEDYRRIDLHRFEVEF